MPDLESAAQEMETESPHGADLRRHRRYVSVDGSVLRLAVRPEFRGRSAILVDVSAGGIGFLMEDPLKDGTVLTFELRTPGDGHSVSRLARVRHSRPHPAPADAPWLPPTPALSRLFRGLFGGTPKPAPPAWLVGCAFDRPLTEAEIQQLLDQLRAQPDLR